MAMAHHRPLSIHLQTTTQVTAITTARANTAVTQQYFQGHHLGGEAGWFTNSPPKIYDFNFFLVDCTFETLLLLQKRYVTKTETTPPSNDLLKRRHWVLLSSWQRAKSKCPPLIFGC